MFKLHIQKKFTRGMIPNKTSIRVLLTSKDDETNIENKAILVLVFFINN